jgi:hypothetical protein
MMDEARLIEIERRLELSLNYYKTEFAQSDDLDLRPSDVRDLIAEVRRLREFEPEPAIYLTPDQRQQAQKEINAMYRLIMEWMPMAGPMTQARHPGNRACAKCGADYTPKHGMDALCPTCDVKFNFNDLSQPIRK